MWLWIQRSGWIVAIIVGAIGLFGTEQSIPWLIVIPLLLIAAIIIWRYRDGEPLDMSRQEIAEAIGDDTSIEQDRRKRAYLGKLIEIEGGVADVSKFRFMGYTEYWVYLRDTDDEFDRLRVKFSFVWASDVLRLQKGDRLKVRGRIDDPSRYGFEIRAIRRPQISKRTADPDEEN